MMDSDGVLLARYVADGDAQAFAALANRYARMVYGAAWRITGNGHDAEEVAQECFLTLARQAGSVRSSLPGWLHSLAVKRAKNVVRGGMRRRQHESAPEASRRTGDVEPTWAEIAPYVDEAIDDLPAELREALVLHYLQGRTQAQIAEQLGVNQSTVSRRLQAAVDLLQGRLRKSGVVASAALLSVLLAQSASEAAPAALIATIGKMAVAGLGKSTAAQAGITLAGGMAVAKTAGLLIVLLGVLSVSGFLVYRALGTPALPPVPPMPAANDGALPEITPAQMQTMLTQAEKQIRQIVLKYTISYKEFTWDGKSPIPDNVEMRPLDKLGLSDCLYKCDCLHGAQFLKIRLIVKELTVAREYAFDGVTGTTLYKEEGEGVPNTARLEGDLPMALNPKSIDLSLADAYMLLYRSEYGVPYSEILRSVLDKTSRMTTGAYVTRTEYDGREVFLLQMAFEAPDGAFTVLRLWCDPARNMLPLRVEKWFPDIPSFLNRKPTTTVNEVCNTIVADLSSGNTDNLNRFMIRVASDIREVSPDSFLAHKIRSYSPNATSDTQICKVLVVQEAEVNGDEKITGKIDLARGTHVTDERTGRKYVAGAVSELFRGHPQ